MTGVLSRRYSAGIVFASTLRVPCSQIRSMPKKAQPRPSDAAGFVSTVKGKAGCRVYWANDALDQLKSVIWFTAEQQVLARQLSAVVVQDNTCLRNT